jgi:hypothetical protein
MFVLDRKLKGGVLKRVQDDLVVRACLVISCYYGLLRRFTPRNDGAAKHSFSD